MPQIPIDYAAGRLRAGEQPADVFSSMKLEFPTVSVPTLISALNRAETGVNFGLEYQNGEPDYSVPFSSLPVHPDVPRGSVMATIGVEFKTPGMRRPAYKIVRVIVPFNADKSDLETYAMGVVEREFPQYGPLDANDSRRNVFYSVFRGRQ